MILLTGNDLKDGRTRWWTGSNWSLDISDAADVGDQAAAIAAKEQAAGTVSEAWEVPAAAGANGPVPSHIKERIRALGPTVRPDLSVNPDNIVTEAQVLNNV